MMALKVNLVEFVKRCRITIHNGKDKLNALVLEDRGESIVVRLNNLDKKNDVKNVVIQKGQYVISSGFQLGDSVIFVGKKNQIFSRREEGIVVSRKNIAGQDLVAVHYRHTDVIRWLPFERLRLIQDHLRNFISGRCDERTDHAELFRLKTLGYGIQFWNQNTGSLSSLDIDPLPHQINLVHHILESGNLNWMIADDVGLGKTIETGMLLTALKYRGEAKRILLVTPAGLTQQWKDELYFKFSFEDFRIFGDDFTINESREWRMYDQVIASIDRLKSSENMALLAGAGFWDIIIVDEAHRLTRSQFGNKYQASDRYKMAAFLRKYTNNLILLTATPHQGKSDQFQSLLLLLRPDLKNEIVRLYRNPEILAEMVYRNNKSKVTDLEGNLLFKGKVTYPISLPVSKEAITFDQLLQHYLRKSAERSNELGGNLGRAIGFVIAIYRKLAASSIEAILNALKNRRERLKNNYSSIDIVEDDRFIGEYEELTVNDKVTEQFIEGEIEYLTELILMGEKVQQDDLKLKGFLSRVIEPILAKNPNEKVVIFTEYISTQRYLESALKRIYGEESTSLINGSMDRNEREIAIQHFNDNGQFIISTEAGGEGINLQENCHILVNFDLPWNPMRLVQRIGRIYRYGQKHQVLIFNIFSEGTADDGIVQLLYQKIDQVVTDLGGISDEFDAGLKDDIFGNIANLIDVDEILENSISMSKNQTEQKLEIALEEAKAVSKKQQELFSYVAQYDSEALEREFVITLDHINAFIRGMCAVCDIEITKEMDKGNIWVLKLSDQVMTELGIRKQNLEITTNRRVKINHPQTEVMDLNHPLMQYFIEKATSYEFGGSVAKFISNDIDGCAIITAIVKWQNLQGTSIYQDIVTFALDKEGYHLNPSQFSQWLLKPAESCNKPSTVVLDYDVGKTIQKVLNEAIAHKKQETMIPHDQYFLSGAWVEK